ncbi:DUF995 domain-containing protein [Aestuariivita boseongensis]|uniref:DUF995 domain-containing protein n=1 Tax=Aestuariivita boseongensis TaxID=1470562 RepID=UPI0009E56EBA
MLKACLVSTSSVLVALSLASTGLADDLPSGARTPSHNLVASAYAGKTDLWREDCEGGIFFSSNGVASAWCAENPDNFAAGPWSVDDQGRLCTDLNWYWPKASTGGSGMSSGGRNCIMHVTDPLGGLWRSWNGTDWWKMRPSTSGLKPGYVFKENVEKTRRKLGL